MLYLVRHGQTPSNAAELIQGRTDPHLSDLGREQAAAAAHLVPANPAVIISSPLTRARQTAEVVAGLRGLNAQPGAKARPVVVDERWIELDFGVLEGQPIPNVRAELWAHWRDDPAWAPEGGESLAAATVRIRAACEELRPRLCSEDIVVVTHVNPIKLAVAWALDVPPRIAGRLLVGLASVTTIAVSPDGTPVLTSFSQLPGDANAVPPNWR